MALKVVYSFSILSHRVIKTRDLFSSVGSSDDSKEQKIGLELIKQLHAGINMCIGTRVRLGVTLRDILLELGDTNSTERLDNVDLITLLSNHADISTGVDREKIAKLAQRLDIINPVEGAEDADNFAKKEVEELQRQSE